MYASNLDSIDCIGGVSGLALYCLTSDGVIKHLIPPTKSLESLTDDQIVDDIDKIESRSFELRSLLRGATAKDEGYRYLSALRDALEAELDRRKGASAPEDDVDSILHELEYIAAGLAFFSRDFKSTVIAADENEAASFSKILLPIKMADFAERADEVRFSFDINKKFCGGILRIGTVMIDTELSYCCQVDAENPRVIAISDNICSLMNDYLSELWSRV